MKKLFTSVALLGLAATAVAAEPFFSTDFSSIENGDFNHWTVVDVNEDGSTWVYSSDGVPSRVYYNYNSSNRADDWLISPAIEVPADGTYVISYEFKGSSYGESFEVWTGSAPTIDAMTEKIASYEAVGDSEQGDMIFVDAKAGTMHLGFHSTSAPDKFRLYIKKVSMQDASNPVDLMVSSIISPVSGEGMGNEEVTVEITNSGKVAVDSFDVAYTIDGGGQVTEHVNAPLGIGEKMEYTFSAKADMTVGHKTYSLKAWTIHPDDLNTANDSKTASVRHIAPAGVPYFMGFEPEEDTSGITFLNLNDDDGDWSINVGGGFFGSFSRTGYGCLAYNYNRDNAADDWAFLEPIEMEAGHYAVKYWYSATAGHPERMKVCYGTSPTPEAMTNVLAEYNPMTNDKYLEAIHILELKEPGKIYFGFYCFSDADENWVVVDDFSIEKVDANTFDVIVGDIQNPSAYMRKGSIKTVSFPMQNVGIIDAKAEVKFSLDGEVVATKEYSLRAMETLQISESDIIGDLTPGEHILKVEAVCDADNNLSNNVKELKIQYLDEAVKLWDFEDGQLPGDLTLRKEDSATDHPDAGEEFNENGFGIFQLEHPVLQTRALAVNTWFTESGSADRWIVLPRMTVNSENACFVWNANSFNPNYLEKYEVKVSKSDDYWWSYTSELTVNAESVTPQTRGIDLGKYNGENIYVAIQVKTQDGEAMIFDNLGLYGDVKFIETGVDRINAADECRLIVDGDTLRVVNGDKSEITICSLDGKTVAKVNGTSADLSQLAGGVYVAKAVTPSGIRTVKFVR